MPEIAPIKDYDDCAPKPSTGAFDGAGIEYFNGGTDHITVPRKVR